MIFLDTHRIAFVHIPKCAGSTVRRQLVAHCPFDDVFVTTPQDHPELGRVYLSHLPLDAVAAHFPAYFDKLQTYKVYAIVHEPKQRSYSALSERLRQVKSTEIASLDDAALQAEADEVVAYLTRTPAPLDPEFIHFRRQSDYIELEGERIVRNLYPMGQIDRLLADLSEQTGAPLNPMARDNSTRNWRLVPLAGAVMAANTLMRNILPDAGYQRVKGWARAFFFQSDGPPKYSHGVLEGLDPFLQSYYARDYEIYAGLAARDQAGQGQAG